MHTKTLILACLFLTACASPTSSETRQVWIDNGALQCEFKGKPLIETAALLEDAGIEVLDSQCAFHTGKAVASMCGIADLNFHIFSIQATDVAEAEAVGFSTLDSLSRDGDPGYQLMACAE